MEWQPIETAPKDGMLLGFYDGMIRLVLWDSGWAVVGRMTDRYWFSPTHWMPLPPPPENK